MYPNQDKVDQEYRNSIYSSVLEQPNTSMTPVHGSAPLQGLPNTFLSSKTPHVSAFRLNSKALIITVSVLSLLAVGGIGLVVLIALAASIISALPASREKPLIVLRHE